MNIKDEIEELEEELIELRRDFHQHPELGYQEFRTSEIVTEYLKKCGLKVKNVAKTGVVGLLEGAEPGKTILLRADMDALPIEEENDLPYKSENKGVMHACGHDGHTAMLLVAAKILSRHTEEMNGNIKFVFQPNEETAGALDMIKEGIMHKPEVDAAFAVHLWSPIASGKIGLTSGPVMAAMDEFKLIIKGKGGHTSSPQESIDPILTASNIVQSVQMVQTREINVLNPTVIVFGRIDGGTTSNVIPEKVELEGTIRYLYSGGDDSEECPKKRFERIVNNICQAHQAEYELEFIPSNQCVDNNPEIIELIKKEVEDNQIVKDSKDMVSYVAMGGEDFSEFVQRVPGALCFIGIADKDKESDYPHHHPRFNIDESRLTTGVEMHIRTAMSYLNN